MEKSEKLKSLIDKFQADLKSLNIQSDDNLGVWGLAAVDSALIEIGVVATDKLVKMILHHYKTDKRIYNIMTAIVTYQMENMNEVNNDDTEPNENE